MANQKAKVTTKSNRPVKEKRAPKVGRGAGRKAALAAYAAGNRRAANRKANLERQEKIRDRKITHLATRARAGKPSRGHARRVRRQHLPPQIGSGIVFSS